MSRVKFFNPSRETVPLKSSLCCTQGAEECHDKVQTIVQDKPTEECTIEPQRTCRHVTKLVPKLTPTEECVDVPKEICTR
jgi:hypothetical protein